MSVVLLVTTATCPKSQCYVRHRQSKCRSSKRLANGDASHVDSIVCTLLALWQKVITCCKKAHPIGGTSKSDGSTRRVAGCSLPVHTSSSSIFSFTSCSGLQKSTLHCHSNFPREVDYLKVCGKWDAAQELAFPAFDIPAVHNVIRGG